MKSAVSAGMLLVRRRTPPELLIVHPGGPFWAGKHEGAWSIPKGLLEPGEDPLAAALREVSEELGMPAPGPPYIALGEARLKSGKRVLAFAARAEIDASQVRSNECEIEWPPRSGKTMRIPEIDEARWVTLEGARRLTNPGLLPLLERAVSVEVLGQLFADLA